MLRNCLILCSLSFIAIIITLAANSDSSVLSYVAQKIVILAVIIPIFGLIFTVKGEETCIEGFFTKIINCVVFISTIALFVWFIIIFFKSKIPYIDFSYIWGGHKTASGYLGILYTIQNESFHGYLIPKFTLFYVEPPLANFVFLICLSTELLLRRTPRILPAALLTFCSLASFSTTGIILLPVIWFAFLVTSQPLVGLRKKYISARILYWVCLISAISVIPIWAILHKSNTKSLMIHNRDIVAGLYSFLDSPVTGHGLGNYQDSFLAFGGSNGSSSGLFSVLAQAGLLLLFLYLIPICIYLWIGIHSKNERLIYFGIILLIQFTVVTIDNSPLLSVYLALSYSMVIMQFKVLRSKKNDMNMDN